MVPICPSYYREFGGFVLSAAINKYAYISINQAFFPGFYLKYSVTEIAESRRAIRHPLIREALELHRMDGPLEIVSIADVPAGTGLGSSGSFLVGLLHALYAHKRQHVTAETLAREAVEVEMNRLNLPVGKQDHYIAAYGGLTCQEYQTDDSVVVTPLRMNEAAITDLRESLMLFFVGHTRSAPELLQEQKRRSEEGDAKMIEDLHFIKQLGLEIRGILKSGDVRRFGPLMDEHWKSKRSRSSGMSNKRIDELYEMALKCGARPAASWSAPARRQRFPAVPNQRLPAAAPRHGRRVASGKWTSASISMVRLCCCATECR